MELRLHFLESFMATGADGATYKVRAYERQARDVSVAGDERWEPTGIVEYRLGDGRLVDAGGDGSLRVAGTGLSLVPQQRREQAQPA